MGTYVYTYYETYGYGLAAYNASPALPEFSGEANYKTANNTGALSSSADALITRLEMWYSMTSGAGGHEFGNEHLNHFDSSWTANLDTTATAQVHYLSQLFNAFPWWTFAPDQSHSVVTAGYGTPNTSNENLYKCTYATTTWDGASHSLTYTPVSTTLTVNLAKFSNPVTALWYDRTTGISSLINGSPLPTAARRTSPQRRAR